MEPIPGNSIMYFSEKGGTDKTLAQEGYRRVIDLLQEQGVTVLAVRGNESFDLESGLVSPFSVRIEQDGDRVHVVTEPTEPVPIGTSSIRTYNRNIGTGVEKFGPNIINPAKVQELDEKDKAYEFLGDLQPLTVVVEPGRLHQQLKDIDTDKVVLKPVKSQNSYGRLIVPKLELLDPEKFMTKVEADGTTHLLSSDGRVNLNLSQEYGYLLQEMINTYQPFPAEIADAVIESCKADYEANKETARKEVRLMLYWGERKLIIPYARLFKPKGDSSIDTRDTEDDDWLLLDIQHHLPQDLEDMATSLADGILKYGDVKYMHGAIDAAWDGHRWRVMELNVWFPVPPKYSLAREHGVEELADVHRRSIADLLGDAARDANRKYQQRNASHKN
jgi:hypothetical protein